MLPWKTIIEIDKDCDTPVYLQIAKLYYPRNEEGADWSRYQIARHPIDVRNTGSS